MAVQTLNNCSGRPYCVLPANTTLVLSCQDTRNDQPTSIKLIQSMTNLIALVHHSDSGLAQSIQDFQFVQSVRLSVESDYSVPYSAFLFDRRPARTSTHRLSAPFSTTMCAFAPYFSWPRTT